MTTTTLTDNQIIIGEQYYSNFKSSCRTKDTLKTYDHKLHLYMKWKEYTKYAELIEGRTSREIEQDIINFINYLKERGYSRGSQQVFLCSLLAFLLY